MKKVLSLVLAVVLVLGMSTVAFAYPKYDVEDVQKSSNNYLKLWAANTGAALDQSDSYKIEADITVNPSLESVYSYGLTGDAMTKANNTFASGTDYVGVFIKDATATSGYSPLAWSDVSRFDVEVKLTSASSIFKGVSLKSSDSTTAANGFAVVRFELYPYLDSSSTKAFTDKIYLTADGKKMAKTELEIKGKFKNGATKVEDEDENEQDLTEGNPRKLEVKANVRNAEIELDYDVFLYTTLYNGRNVYARASNVANNTQFAVMDKYTSIDETVSLYTAGLTSTTKVFFDRPEKLYVYGVDTSASYDAVADTVKLVYLGTTDQKLPLVDQYFLSTKELVIETTPVEPEPSVPAESSASNPVGGGDTTAPNANYNPGTGC